MQDGGKGCEIEISKGYSNMEPVAESMNVEENRRGIAHHHNLRYVCSDGESKTKTHIPEEVIESLLNGKLALPYSERFPLPAVINCIGGCSEEYYCSSSVSAWPYSACSE
eukprot:Gb_20232 [translate_table: standard]